MKNKALQREWTMQVNVFLSCIIQFCLPTDLMEYTAPPFPLDNTSSPPSYPSLCPSAITLYFLPSVYALIFLTALLGNALSLWVFFGCITTTSPIHVYLSHLSISNMLLSLTTPFLAAYYAQGSTWMLTDFPCQLVVHTITPVVHINIYTSLMILTSVALSRFACLIQHTHASRPSIYTTLLPQGFFACLTKTASARIVCATTWVMAAGGVVPVTVYYSVKEAVVTGHEEVCYNPEVELGGSLSGTLVWIVIAIFYVLYLLVLLSYLIVLKHIRRSRRNTNITASQNLLGRVLRNIVIIQVAIFSHHFIKIC